MKLNKIWINLYNLTTDLTDNKLIIDYSNYTYTAPQPHFTHDNIVRSLSTEDLDEFNTIKITQQTNDDSLDNSCGTWQKTYTKLHDDILNGVEPQKYVGYVCDPKVKCGGLTER